MLAHVRTLEVRGHSLPCHRGLPCDCHMVTLLPSWQWEGISPSEEGRGNPEGSPLYGLGARFEEEGELGHSHGLGSIQWKSRTKGRERAMNRKAGRGTEARWRPGLGVESGSRQSTGG